MCVIGGPEPEVAPEISLELQWGACFFHFIDCPENLGKETASPCENKHDNGGVETTNVLMIHGFQIDDAHQFGEQAQVLFRQEGLNSFHTDGDLRSHMA